MSLELHPTDIRQAQLLWTTWETGNDVELEATFQVPNLTGWLDIMQHLRSLGLQENPEPPKLNIMVAGGLRFTLVGEGVIQEFCKDNSLKGKPFHVIRKEKKQTGAGTDNITEVDWKEYGVRIKLRRETTLSLDDPRVREVVSRWATIPKSFRYMQRYSFTSLKHKGLQFDLSMIKQSQKDARGQYIQATSFTNAEIVKQPINYEAEVEVVEGATFQSLMVGIASILRGQQRSFVLTRYSVRKSVLDFLTDKTGARKGNFPGPQPVTLERENTLPTDDDSTPNIRTGDYNVTDKADGQRCLLIVMPSGGIYLMDMNLNVYGTDCRLSKPQAAEWAGCIMDGEWVKRNAENKPMSNYYAFDIYNGLGGADVTKLPFMVRSDNPNAASRFSAMTAAVAILAQAERTVLGIPGHFSLHIAAKNFRTPANSADPFGIFKEAAAVLDFVKETKPYHSDGLIFTPNKAPLPKNAGSWKAQFKWKPAEENSIDFMVSIEKETDIKGNPTAVDEIKIKVREDTNQIVRCKTLRLHVGSTISSELQDPRNTILFMKPLPDTLATRDEQYRPALFTPQPIDPMASVCYVAIDAGATDAAGAASAASDLEAQDDTIRCIRSGDPITHGSIVEMAYHPNAPPGWRWEPMRVRWDKTERFQRGIMRRTMNSDMVAQSIWSSIHAPVTDHMIRTGAEEDTEQEAVTTTSPVMSKSYYKQKAPGIDQRRVGGMRDFHNKYIKEDILLRVLNRGQSLYDMTCGQGGDMHKWYRRGASWVLGTDIAEMNLTENKNGAYRRYADRLIENKGKYTPMLFVQANAATRLSDGGAGLTPMDRTILRTLWGSQEPDAPPYALQFRGKAANGFDVVSCMFSLHYFFKDLPTLDGWLQNLSETLATGGYFIGCCFDGDAIAQFLSTTSLNETRKGIERGTDGNTEVWTITRRYEGNELPATAEGLGKAVDVSFISIGETYTEYLVSWSYLQQRLGEIGLELLTVEELANFGLLHSTNMFEESLKMAALSGKNYPMTPTLKQFSFLNRWFILRRRSVGAAPSRTTVRMTATPAVQQPTTPNEFAPSMDIQEMGLPESVTAAMGEEPVMEEQYIQMDELETDAFEAATAATVAPTHKIAGGEIHKFYETSQQKDDLKIGDKGWKRWMSTYSPFPITDLEDESIVYPSLEAALTAAKYKYASTKPALSARFSETGDIHQTYELQRAEKGATLTEKEAHDLMEKEGDEIRKAAKEAEMKKAGASFKKEAWLEKVEDIVRSYIQQRYKHDERLRNIMEGVRKTDTRLIFYTTAAPNEFSGVVKDEVIQGRNLIGKAYMNLVGLTY